jgi:hypothetical protein
MAQLKTQGASQGMVEAGSGFGFETAGFGG